MAEPLVTTALEPQGPRLNGSVLIPRSLLLAIRQGMKASIMRHRTSPAPESQKVGSDLEELYIAIGAALSSFDDRRDLWGDSLEPKKPAAPATPALPEIARDKAVDIQAAPEDT